MSYSNKLAEQIIEYYLKHLREEIEVEKSNGELIFSFPFYISGGHFIEISVKQLQDYILFTDHSRTIGDLFLSGLDIKGKNRILMERIVNEYKLQIEGNEIKAYAKLEKSGEILHKLIQTLFKIGDFELLKKIKYFKAPKIVREVKKIIDETNIPYKFHNNAILPGEEIKRIQFDFLIENGTLKAIKTIDIRRNLETYISSWAFKFDDLRKVSPQTERIVIYNPENEQWYEFAYLLEAEGRAKTIPFDKEEIKRIILQN